MHGKAIKFYIPESPCLGCESRRVGCHGNCGKFAKYRETVESYKKKRDAVVKPERDVISHFAESREKNIKTKSPREQRKMGVRW